MAKTAKKERRREKFKEAAANIREVRDLARRIREELFLDVSSTLWAEDQMSQLLDSLRALAGVLEVEIRLTEFVEQSH